MRRALLLVPLCVFAACSLLTSLDDLSRPDAGADNNADAADVTQDSDADASGGPEGSDDDAADGSTVYHDLTSTSFWSTFDMGTVYAATRGFLGAAFDGRYVYLAPSTILAPDGGQDLDSGLVPDGVLARYDTHTAFTDAVSWSTFDTTTVSTGAKGFRGTAFDGRYVYLVPNNNGSPDGVVTRYDTQATFSDPASWSTFDTTTVAPSAESFGGAVFDGRYVYLVPNGNGPVTRYDTKASFADSTSWSTFDTTSVDPSAEGFLGAVFDGRYVYLVPNGNSAPNGVVARYDTRMSFSDAPSWSAFDTTTVNPNASGFCTAAFDGRYVYLVPWFGGSVVARYDTQASFMAQNSWRAFDMTTVDISAKGFRSAAFDGRYVYFLPQFGGTLNGVIARYDTQLSFTALASWTTFDPTKRNPGLSGFKGAAFDGRYLYLLPNQNGLVARFDAKTPPSMPNLPGWYGSFF